MESHIERCLVQQFADSGIRSEGGNETDIFVLDSIARNNAASGLILAGALVARSLTVDNSRFEANGHHGVAAEVIQGTITRSIMSGNGINGLHQTQHRLNVTSTTSAHNGENGYFLNAAQMTLKHAVARGNAGAGLRVDNSSTARIAASVFAHNAIGINNSGTVRTLADNVVDGNTNDAVGGTVQAVTPF